MRRLSILLGIVTSILLSLAGLAAPQEKIAPTKACQTLVDLDLSGVTDKRVHIESAKEMQLQGGDFCEVKGTIEPKIGFVVQLPLQNWTGRFLQIGCGGLCGHIPNEYAQTYACGPLANGEFAIAMTDMGHEGPGPEFGDDPQLRVDFAYRGVHQTALAAKAFIAAFYGRAPEHSYFLGCSDGGREALMEVQRFPEDFDGVTAGSSAMNFLVQNTFYHAWNARSNVGADGKPIITAKDLPILHHAALTACIAEAGVIADPLRCSFDPSVTACSPGQKDDCLTPAQVEVARKFYDGPRDASGLPLTPGGPMPGSELSWAGVFVPKPGEDFIFGRVIAGGAIAHLAFPLPNDPKLGIDQLKFDRATYEKFLQQHALYDTTNPDIKPFVERGGKLVLWHGASDPHISPTNSISYYDAVKATLGEARAEESVRFFLIPGLYHCEGGEGPVQTDVLTAMIKWVEEGRAPDELIMREGDVSRPVFPYPALAKYDGDGDRSRFSSYKPAAPTLPFVVRKWIGEDLFKPKAP
jgi:hypothetical protein